MFVDPLKKQLELLGWKHVASKSHFGEEFDLVGSRRFLFSQWNVLVKYIDVLDDEEVRRCAASLLHISAKSKSLDRCFLACLIAGKVEIDPEYLTEAGDSFGLFGVLGLLEGGGNVLLVDLADCTIYGTVPWFPYAVRKFSRDLQAVFQG
ncbi:MAG: hypothetical protein ACFCD0_24365 [Gemmataceae bacterium]